MRGISVVQPKCRRSIWGDMPRVGESKDTIDVRESCFCLVGRLSRLTRPKEHIGHRQHRRDGQDLVGAAAQHTNIGINALKQICKLLSRKSAGCKASVVANVGR